MKNFKIVTVVVPPEFACNALYKGRALQYAVEIRRKEGKNTGDIYVFHLDDESLITKQTSVRSSQTLMS